MKNRIIKRVEACVLAGLLLFMSGVATLPVMAAEEVYTVSDEIASEEEPSASHDEIHGTLINLTSVFTGEAATHDCQEYLVSTYDENAHWEQCALCGKQYHTAGHNYITMGDDSCGWWSSGQIKYCSDCGYQTTYKREHTDDTSTWHTRVDAKWHYRFCTSCQSYGYTENCVDADGNAITCAGGTCVICGYTYSPEHMIFNCSSGESGSVYCGKCGLEFVRFDNNTYYWSDDNSIVASIRFTWWNQEIFGTNADTVASYVDMGGPGGGVTGETSDLNAYASGGCVYASCTVTYPYAEYGATWANQCWSLAPYCTRVTSPVTGGKIENVAPTILDTSLSYGKQSDGYSTKANLSVSCTDNWNDDPNFVQIRLVDENKEPVSNWITCTRSGSSYSQNVDLVTEVTGSRTYYVQARDAGGNQSERAVSVSNLDSKAPTVTSSLTTEKDWSKTKKVTFTCTDEGTGNVEIAFNDQSDYQRAEYSNGTYSRTYTFTGDVYGSIKAAVYFKDGVGNVTTEFVEIYNLDNTCPVIANTAVSDAIDSKNQAYGWNIAIEGTDTNDRLSKEGGGIVKYALSKSTKQPVSTAFVNNASLLIGQSGTYYVWVMDAAGNVAMADNPVTLHSDLHFNGCEVSRVNYNGKQLKAFYYNGKRIRL